MSDQLNLRNETVDITTKVAAPVKVVQVKVVPVKAAPVAAVPLETAAIKTSLVVAQSTIIEMTRQLPNDQNIEKR